MRILIATDGSQCSEEAVREVARRPWPDGSAIKVISVVEIPATFTADTWALPASYCDDLERMLTATAKTAVANAVQILGANETKDLSVSSDVFRGRPKHAILDEADTWEADLIVVGSHGYGLLDRVLLGSVSLAVASHATCSVEIVRRRESETPASQP